MPLLRRRYRRRTNKRRYRRRTMGRNRTGVSRSLMYPRRSVHSFKRKCFLGNIDVTTTDVFGSYVFRLSDLPNYLEFVNLYDLYRIKAVKFTLIPGITAMDGNPLSTAVTLPQVRSVLDYTDSTVPASFNELYEYSNCKMTQGNRFHSRYFKPALLSTVYETAVSNSYTPKWGTWVSTDDASCPHYGLKYGINAFVAAAPGMRLRIYATYYFQCKFSK